MKNINYKNKFLLIIAIGLLIIIGITGCKKFVKVNAPVTSTNRENVFSTNATAIAVLTGLYTSISTGTGLNFATGPNSISVLCGLSADELSVYNGGINTIYGYYYRNALSVTGGANVGAEYWQPIYNLIYKCNGAIEGLENAQMLSPQIRQQLLGEAKFMRAFFYFYLVNLFGDVPLITITDYSKTALLSRSTVIEINQQIIADLKDAQNLLSSDYLNGDLQPYTAGVIERLRPTKWAATALLAREYLFVKDYVNAEAQASSVIGNLALYDTVSLNNVFLKNSKEAIWQLQPVNTGRNTEDARVFVLPSNGPSSFNPVYLSSYLLKSFEANDLRKANWVGKVIPIIGGDTIYYPYKYKVNTQNPSVTSTAAMSEYLMVFRLAEQLLIRAEARGEQNNISGAQSDLNIIRTRAGLPNTTASIKDDLLAAILNERRHELFTEWGHRWLDLKRTGKVDEVMTTVTPLKNNGSFWQSYQQLYPLPQSDINYNSNLIQNPGY